MTPAAPHAHGRPGSSSHANRQTKNAATPASSAGDEPHRGHAVEQRAARGGLVGDCPERVVERRIDADAAIGAVARAPEAGRERAVERAVLELRPRRVAVEVAGDVEQPLRVDDRVLLVAQHGAGDRPRHLAGLRQALRVVDVDRLVVGLQRRQQQRPRDAVEHRHDRARHRHAARALGGQRGAHADDHPRRDQREHDPEQPRAGDPRPGLREAVRDRRRERQPRLRAGAQVGDPHHARALAAPDRDAPARVRLAAHVHARPAGGGAEAHPRAADRAAHRRDRDRQRTAARPARGPAAREHPAGLRAHLGQQRRHRRPGLELDLD